ncbi:Xaa-His dipeptidase [Cricetibacter osteomyelitidis]|uniref:Cytosol non-specific dipeptidase n=1 Tax=Cricetibacter osteomyelitidis TaxID=1521931 RepID=A0A4R2T5X5_9PAST|nr:aminoacyl-histidine dipeptidase [Cricetibacter osteomyelitidis]TCP96254.1 Xaa-His dipeptidase [Cricetibacter osteomyelitidis]
MSEISTLQPQLLWQWFDQICAIPHPSYHEEKLADFIVQWAKNKNLFVERDEAGNILIRKAATPGMENRPSIALQAHLDMVPQANEGTPHDFTKDPISPYIDGDWVKAKSTTLGADNGIGLASALAVLDSDDVVHPPLEVLLTMTEEAGMDGAKGLRCNWLQSNLMINTDTEENGEIYIGCAGGIDGNLTIPLSFKPNKYKQQYELVLKGLRGGHSGCDIHSGRVNAIKLLARFLVHLTETVPQFEFTLSHIRGGSVRNAIPREAAVTLAFNDDVTLLESAVENFKNLMVAELAVAEPNLTLFLQSTEKSLQVFEATSTRDVIHLLNALPNGVIRWSDSVPGVVETSLSLGVVNTEEDKVKANVLIRSLNESGKQYVRETLVSITELSGDDIRFYGSYPGWNPDIHSPLTALTKQVYDKILGEEAKIKVIHAGLECGLIKEKYPNLDVVSVGPTILNAHSPDEKVHIPAVQTYWKLLTELLANIH